MEKSLLIFILLALSLFAALPSCKDDEPTVDYAALADCSGVPAASNTYTNSIKALLDASCALAGCHGAGTAEGGFDFSTYAMAKKGFEDDKGLCSVHHGKGCKPMPDGSGQLSTAQLLVLDCWVKNGMPQ
jgi:hypothetical protein